MVFARVNFLVLRITTYIKPFRIHFLSNAHRHSLWSWCWRIAFSGALWFSSNAQCVCYHRSMQQHWMMLWLCKHRIQSARHEHIGKNCAKKKVPSDWLAVQMIMKVNGHCEQICIDLFFISEFYFIYLHRPFSVGSSEQHMLSHQITNQLETRLKLSSEPSTWFITRNTRERKWEHFVLAPSPSFSSSSSLSSPWHIDFNFPRCWFTHASHFPPDKAINFKRKLHAKNIKTHWQRMNHPVIFFFYSAAIPQNWTNCTSDVSQYVLEASEHVQFHVENQFHMLVADISNDLN